MKPKLFLISLIILVVLLIVISIFTAVSHQSNQNTVNFFPSPTPLPIQSAPHLQNVIYDQDQTDKMIQTVENKPSISPSDSDIKTSIISSLGNDSGTVYTSPNEFRIDYVQSPDLFQIEILTTDFHKAKTDAVAWLQSQGFSTDGICKLPVTFYLNFDIKQQLPQGTVFQPLPDGC